MRATEIIRSLLDIIDGVEAANPPPVQQVTIAINSDSGEESMGQEQPANVHDEMARFRQISDLLHNDAQTYANEPSIQVADIESVTSEAGGGVNGPKHPADMRSDSVSMYPAAQWKGE